MSAFYLARHATHSTIDSTHWVRAISLLLLLFFLFISFCHARIKKNWLWPGTYENDAERFCSMNNKAFYCQIFEFHRIDPFEKLEFMHKFPLNFQTNKQTERINEWYLHCKLESLKSMYHTEWCVNGVELDDLLRLALPLWFSPLHFCNTTITITTTTIQ